MQKFTTPKYSYTSWYRECNSLPPELLSSHTEFRQYFEHSHHNSFTNLYIILVTFLKFHSPTVSPVNKKHTGYLTTRKLDVNMYRECRTPDRLQVKTHTLSPQIDSCTWGWTCTILWEPQKELPLVKPSDIRKPTRIRKTFTKMMLLNERNLTKWGYPRSLINKTLRRIKFSLRPSVMDPNYTDKSKSKRPDDNTQPSIVRQGIAVRPARPSDWSINTGPLCREHNKPRLSYNSNCNLARHLVRAKLKNDTSQQSLASDGSSHQLDAAEG